MNGKSIRRNRIKSARINRILAGGLEKVPPTVKLGKITVREIAVAASATLQ